MTPPRKRVNIGRRVWLFASLIAVCLAGLVFQLWRVQIEEGPHYRALVASEGGGEVRVRLPPVRGTIRDRNGLILAGNQAACDIEFDLPEMVRSYRERHGRVPTLQYRGVVHQMEKVMTEPDIVQIVNEDVVPRLHALGLPTDYDSKELELHFRTDAEVPFVFARNVGFATMAEMDEHGLGLSGARVAKRPVRRYPFGALAAHVLGYVGEPQKISDLPDAQDFQFYEANVKGRAQIEEAMDKDLRGTPGTRLMERNLKGVIDREMGVTPPQAGDSVYLTLDAGIQFITEQALRAVGRAGAVVVDPNTGDILAMASVPSFDPNSFIPSIPDAAWRQLIDDPAAPLVNRALAAFPPGSTFKAVTSLAGATRGLANRTFTCTGGVTYGNHYFKCWKASGHGTLHLSDAIKVSCNAFFYQYGNAAGIDAIDAVGSLLGLGQAPDLGLNGEDAGILPGPEWLRMHSPRERWSDAQTANVSIGQGYDLVSPLQLAMVYASIANGGTVYYPRLVDRVASADGSPLDEPPPEAPVGPRVRARLADAGISSADLDLVRTGLWKVVNEDGGTARKARLPGGIVAGKTGTAQAQLHGKQDTIAWFVGFAPYDHPRYVVCVMVQGGKHGGSVAAPIVARILAQTLAMDEGEYQPPLAPLPPAHSDHPFQMIAAVDLDNPGKPGEVPQAGTPAVASGTHPHKVARRKEPARSTGSPRPSGTPAAEHPGFFQRLFHFGHDE